jgi:outer membrane protein assembly factor BamB
MYRFALGLVLVFSLALSVPAADWSQFRGPTQDGHADAAKLPTEWDKTKNVAWRAELPGEGWSSPAIAGGKIYVTAAVPGQVKFDYSLRTLCLDAKTGEILWDVEVFKEDGAKAPKIHSKNSHASPTPLVDGEQVFVHFGHMGTACLNAKDGKTLWTQQSLPYSPVHGAGGSPVLAGEKLIFSIDGTDKQMVVALDRKTGEVAWKTPRNTKPAKAFSFCTPLLITEGGVEQLISPGSDVVMSLDPKTGKEIWRVQFSGYSIVPRPVYGNGIVYLSTGYDTPVLYAIKVNGKGDVTNTHVAWKAEKVAPRNASPLLVGNDLYVVTDGGLLTCLDAKTGTERWNERVGGAFSSSPIYAGGLVYLLDETGATTIFKPGESFDLVAKNKLGERTQASYAVDGKALLLRTQQALYRIEKK